MCSVICVLFSSLYLAVHYHFGSLAVFTHSHLLRSCYCFVLSKEGSVLADHEGRESFEVITFNESVLPDS